MEKCGNMTEQNFAGVNFQIFSTEYHTWGFPVFAPEAPLQGGMSGIPKWYPREINGVYLGK